MLLLLIERYPGGGSPLHPTEISLYCYPTVKHTWMMIIRLTDIIHQGLISAQGWEILLMYWSHESRTWTVLDTLPILFPFYMHCNPSRCFTYQTATYTRIATNTATFGHMGNIDRRF